MSLFFTASDYGFIYETINRSDHRSIIFLTNIRGAENAIYPRTPNSLYTVSSPILESLALGSDGRLGVQLRIIDLRIRFPTYLTYLPVGITLEDLKGRPRSPFRLSYYCNYLSGPFPIPSSRHYQLNNTDKRQKRLY